MIKYTEILALLKRQSRVDYLSYSETKTRILTDHELRI